MPIAIECPNASCRSRSMVADAIAGRGVKCKKCGTPFKAVAKLDLPASGLPFVMLPAEYGRYRVLSLLGQGGMGAVYLADDNQLKRKVALKLPNFDVSDTKRLERFVREAKSSAGLQHPNICPVFDAGLIEGRPFISMAYIAGKTLDDEIDPDRPMDAKRAAEIVRKIALALQDAHENGIVHRDLKPANVMMSAKGEPVVMDFGLAKNVGEFDENESKLTKQGAVMGTPSYMSPEQVRGDTEQIGPATDIYALGVILFELITGRRPYSGPVFVVLAQILTAPVPLLREFRPDADARLEAICQQAMAKDIAARPSSMAMFAAQLTEYLQHVDALPAVMISSEVPVLVTPSDDILKEHIHKSKPSRLPIFVGVAALILILVAGIFMTLRTKRSDVGVASPDKMINEGESKDEKPTVSAPSAGLTGVAEVDFSARKGGDEVSFEIAPGVKMVFCWIPKGNATLGSPGTEKDRKRGEAEHPFATDGFWLAKTECTQKEWESVMASNPSFFSASGDGKAKVQGLDTGNFPVELVSWDDAQLFVKKLNASGSTANAFGISGSFKLPHEDQWEYAYRGGKGNMQAFYWGNTLNGHKANTNGNYPYGTELKGPYLERTSAVGSYAKSAPHPWGLSDMSGNVWEWCDNLSEIGSRRVNRGGGWRTDAGRLRSSERGKSPPSIRHDDLGFRVCFSLSR